MCKKKKKIKKLLKKMTKIEREHEHKKKSVWQRFWENEDNCFG